MGSLGLTATCGLLSLLEVVWSPKGDASVCDVNVGGGSTDMSVRSSRFSTSGLVFRDRCGRRRPCFGRLGEADMERDQPLPNSRTKELNFIDANLGLVGDDRSFTNSPEPAGCHADFEPRHRD